MQSITFGTNQLSKHKYASIAAIKNNYEIVCCTRTEIMAKKVLVTGAAGFIGSHLCKSLLDEDCHVIALDNLHTGSENNLTGLRDYVNFVFINQDVTKPINISADEIYNLACPASPVHYQFDPIKTLKTNFIGSLNVLEQAQQLNCKVLQASTSEVYGEPLLHPQTETYWGNVNPIGIRSCYDEGKRSAETLFFDFHRKYGLEIKVARIFNTFGPNMSENDGRVVSNFIVQALNNEPITVYGEGKQTRSFCYIDDLVMGLKNLMLSKRNVTGPVNLGNPTEIEIIELAKLIISLTGSRSKIVYEAMPSDDPSQRKPDISLAKKVLKWEPRIELESGLNKTIEYFDKLLKRDN